MRPRNNRGPAATIIRTYLKPPRVDFAVGRVRGRQPITTRGRSTTEFSNVRSTRTSSRDQTEFRNGPRDAENRTTRLARHFAAPDLSIAAIAHSEGTTPDIRVRKGSRHFCAAGTFCARFRHAMMQATTRAQSAKQSFIRKTKQRRTQFVADVFDRRRN